MFELIKIQPGCPYYGWETSIDLTCEEGLCHWLRQPANTFSSFIFLLAAAFILRSAIKNKTPSTLAIGWVSVFIGCASTLAHATHLRIFGFADFSFQYLLILVLLWFNFKRLDWKTSRLSLLKFCGFFWLLTAVIQWNFIDLTLFLYGGLFVCLLATEWLAYSRHRRGGYRDFFYCATTLALAAIAFLLDTLKIVCDPNNHFFQMHAVWHILAAVSLIFLARHYQQFDSATTPPAR